jgi:hypothetical protein
MRCEKCVCHRWLVDNGALAGNWTLPDVGLLVVILGAFANRDATPFIDGRFEETEGEPVLVIRGGIGSEVRLRGQIGRSVTEPASATPLSTVEQLAAFHGRGLLSDEEFRLATEHITPTDAN